MLHLVVLTTTPPLSTFARSRDCLCSERLALAHPLQPQHYVSQGLNALIIIVVHNPRNSHYTPAPFGPRRSPEQSVSRGLWQDDLVNFADLPAPMSIFGFDGANPPAVLYHYTSMSAFLSIVRSGRIWATHCR